jgi:hypothetical protein
VSSTLQTWIDQRMQVWTTLVDPMAATNWTALQLQNEPAHLWWTHNYGGTQTAQQNFIAFVQTPYSVIKQLEGQANPQLRRYNIRLSTNLRMAGVTDRAVLKNFNVGGSVRWEAPGAIGFWGVQSLPASITDLDVSKPIYDKAHTYFDLVVGYKTRLFSGKVPVQFQLNVRNLTESGCLKPVGAYPDGTINTYRIVDPRQFILSATFDL